MRSSSRNERAAQQPDAADEVGALRDRLAPPSQLIRVLGGPERWREMQPTVRANVTRWWAMSVLIAGLLCLLPTMAITIAYYAHVSRYADLSFEFLALLVPMTLVYVTIIGGPVLMLVAGTRIARYGVFTKRAGLTAFGGGAAMLAWASCALAMKPPDPPVRHVVTALGVLSGYVVASAFWRLRSDHSSPKEEAAQQLDAADEARASSAGWRGPRS
jgi:hypothetical protein